MAKKLRAGEVVREFVPGFNAHELKWKQTSVAGLPDGKRYISDVELAGSTIFVLRTDRDGNPDKTFGPEGWRAELLPIDPHPTNALLTLSDGSVIASIFNQYEVALVKFREDGTLDPDFGINGKIVHSSGERAGSESPGLSEENSYAVRASAGQGALVPAEDGKFYALSGRRFFSGSILRCHSDGALDTTFNNTGVVSVRHPTRTVSPNSIVTTADGGVIAVGSIMRSDDGVRVFFCSYRADGSIDEGFGENGFSLFDFESVGIPNFFGQDMELNHVIRLSNGGFAACGEAVLGTANFSTFCTVFCVDSSGVLLPSFNEGKPGTFPAFPIPDGEETSAIFGGVVEQDEGKIVMVGDSITARAPGYLEKKIIAVRFLPDGSQDPEFGIDGVLRHRCFDAVVSSVASVTLDADKKVLIGGSFGDSNSLASGPHVVLELS